MRKNRITYALLLIASGVFVSFYGGKISYAIFYTFLFLPVFSYLYTFYVYLRFKMYQTVDKKTMVKGETNHYTYTISNEDFITYQKIKVNFYTEESHLSEKSPENEWSLLPGEKVGSTSKLICHYRGEYPVGIKSVEVSDLLGLFQITYPVRAKLIATVLPRVLVLPSLFFAPEQKDEKKHNPKAFFGETVMDVEVRPYQTGDSIRQIHQKLSARTGEWMTRKLSYLPKEEVCLYLDLKRQKEECRIQYEDILLELSLAISDYYRRQSMPSHIMYEDGKLQQVYIEDKKTFNNFYRSCATMNFHAEGTVYQFVWQSMKAISRPVFAIIITSELTEAGLKILLEIEQLGHQILLFLVCMEETKQQQTMIELLSRAGVTVKKVHADDQLEDLLCQGV